MHPGDSEFTTNRDDSKTIPEFFLKAVRQGFKSEQDGRDIFEDVEFVRIITPGNMRSIPEEPVADEHRARWPRQYDAFKRGMDDPTEGTPLSQVAFITPAQVRMLAALNVKTVENLANVGDGELQNLPLGGRDLRQKAQAFLENAQTNAPLERERAAREAAEAEVNRLKGQLADLADRLEALENKGAGRKAAA
jgi:hypothetical protein